MKLITSKFAGKCAACAKPYPEGEPIYYDGKAARGKRAFHKACYTQPVERAVVPVAPEGEIYRKHFDSLSDFRALTPAASSAEAFQHLGRHSGGWQFGSAGSLEGYETRMSKGWAAGAEKLSAIACREAPTPTDVRRRPVRADQGDEYDIHTAWRGQLDRAWTRRVRRTTLAPKRITILSMVAGACVQNEDQFFWRGGAATRLADALSAAGHAVQIVVACVSGRVVGETPMAYSFTLKPFEQPMDVSAVAAVLCQVGFHRYEFFKAMASLEGCESRFGWNVKAELLGIARVVAEDYGRDAYVLPYDVDTEDKAAKWVNSTLDQIEGADAELLAA